MTMSFTTPSTFQSLPCQLMVSPTGSFRPNCLIAASMNKKPDESHSIALEKFRPSFISQPTTLPKSGSTSTVPNTSCRLGSFPLQLRLSADDHRPVAGLPDGDTPDTAPVFSSSSRNALYCLIAL